MGSSFLEVAAAAGAQMDYGASSQPGPSIVVNGPGPSNGSVAGPSGQSPYMSAEDKSDAATSSSVETVKEYLGGSRGAQLAQVQQQQQQQSVQMHGKPVSGAPSPNVQQSQPAPVQLGPNFTSVTRRTQVHPLKMKILEGSGPFPEHCKSFDANYRVRALEVALFV